MKQCDRIVAYIKENPSCLEGSYEAIAKELGVHNAAVQYAVKKMELKKAKKKLKEVDNTSLKEIYKSVYKQVSEEQVSKTGTPGGKFNANALKDFVKDTMSDFEIVKRVDKGVKKLAIISDLHGVFLCDKTFNCFLEVARNNHFDEIVLNGDVLDLPLLSKHSHKLINRGPMLNYSETGEIEFVKKDILQKLRQVTSANIVFRLGNHSERITNPLNLSQNQLAKLAIVYNNYGTVKLEQMLNLEKMGIEFDPTPVRSYYGVFDVLHGLSLAKNAPEQNIMMRMSSGSSGHSHRLQVKYFTKSDKEYVWVESGCMRLKYGVEYLPTGVTADWQTGFVTVNFDTESDKTRFYAEAHAIIHGSTSFHGKIYRG